MSPRNQLARCEAIFVETRPLFENIAEKACMRSTQTSERPFQSTTAVAPVPRERGSYLVESGIAVLAATFLVVGLADISRIFHARGALRAAVTDGLRCLYPADPTCVSAALPDADLSGNRFNAWVWGTPGWILPRSSYSIFSTVFNEPVLEVPFSAQKLDSIQVSQPHDSYLKSEILYPVQAHSPYLLKIRDLPLVDGQDPLNPVLKDRTTLERQAAALKIPIRSIVKAGVHTVPNAKNKEDEYGPAFEIGSLSFRVLGAWPERENDVKAMQEIRGRYGVSVPCYQGHIVPGSTPEKIAWPTGAAPATCSYRLLGNASVQQRLLNQEQLSVPVMLRISGVSRATSSKASGKLVVSMSWSSGGKTHTHRLGGRVFSSTNFAHLVVRGADWSDITREARRYYRNRYDSEINLYGTLPAVPIDATVTLRFYLSSLNGENVGWQGDSIEVFYPQFRFVHEAYACGRSSNPTECTSPPSGVQVLFSTIDPSQVISASAVGASSCLRDSPTPLEESSAKAIERIQTEIERAKTPTPYSFWLRSGDECTAVIKSYSCQDTFHEYMQGCYVEEGSDVITDRCSITDFRPETDSIVRVFRTERSNIRTERRGACSEESFPDCAKPNVSRVGERYLGGSAGRCGSAINVSPVSEQDGPLLDSTCIDIAKRLEGRYRERQRIPASVPIVVLSQAEAPLFSADPPTDVCTPRQLIDAGDTRRALCARMVSKRAAMQCCERHAGRCVVEEIPGTGPTVRTGGIDYLLDVARRRIIESVQTMYPPASSPFVCEEGSENCLHVETALTGDTTTAVAAARVSVPLTLFSWLGKLGTAHVHYSETRRLERSLVGASTGG